MPSGDNDVARVNTHTRTIAVIMPNVESIRPDQWQKYVVSVDQVEGLTDYDFFSNVATETQAVIESRVDGQTNTNSAPTITSALDVTRQQGNAVSNLQIAIVNDVDQTVNTLTLTVNGNTSATVNGVTVSNIAASASGIVTANVVAASNATAAGFNLRVTDNQGSFAQTTLNVAVTSVSYEADADPRPNQAGNPFPSKSSDGIVGTGDVTQIRRFVLGFDTPDYGTTNEFRKADSAPLSSFGDGIVAAGDVTQARRYALGYDALHSAAGPTMPGSSSFSESFFAGELFNQKTVALFDDNTPLNDLRTLTPIAVSRVGAVLTSVLF